MDTVDHRRIGVELNNSLWQRIDEGSLSPDLPIAERLEILYAAYTSTYHWIQVGTAANRARGEHLISRIASALGFIDEGLVHAERCLDLVASNPDVVEDWDLAFAHEALARALAGKGMTEDASGHRSTAIELTAAVADDDDRAVLEVELAREPWFGLDTA